MVQLENLTTDAVEICIIKLCEDSGSPDIPSESHWRVGLLNSEYGRQRLHEVLECYPEALHEILATWGKTPTTTED